MKKQLLLYITVLLFSASVFADNAPVGPTVGDANIMVSGEGVTSASIGENTTAAQEVGTIDAGNIDTVGIEVEAEGDTDAAIGEDSCAEQKVGSIGGQNDC